MRHWKGLPEELVGAQSIVVFRARFDGALSNLVFRVLSSPSHSLILWFCDIKDFTVTEGRIQSSASWQNKAFSIFDCLLSPFSFLFVLTGKLSVVNSINYQKYVLAKVSQQALYDSEKKPSGHLAQVEPYGQSTSQMAVNQIKRFPPPTLSRKCWPNWQIKDLAG